MSEAINYGNLEDRNVPTEISDLTTEIYRQMLNMCQSLLEAEEELLNLQAEIRKKKIYMPVSQRNA